MSAPKSAVSKAVAAERLKAQAVDDRRQHQIQNQVASINRLLDGHTYDEELAELHQQLADTQTQLDTANRELAELRDDTKEK